MIAAHDARASASRGELDDGALLISMLPWAMSFADAPVSGFRVGAVALGASGAAYAGGNLEFAGAPLAASVHAEQAAVANAWLHGETAIAAIGASAEPCGHCRQFLMELGDGNVAIAVPGKPVATLGELLPRAFGPRDLDVRGGLLAASNRALSRTVDPTDELAVAALNAAEASYAPYTG
ncbi:MAG TPA: cytidine deaminase, partial [Candidatus Elarobacter sp.]|nr:cytidine deaminase [Candidatus Elarobacter sp.]